MLGIFNQRLTFSALYWYVTVTEFISVHLFYPFVLGLGRMMHGEHLLPKVIFSSILAQTMKLEVALILTDAHINRSVV